MYHVVANIDTDYCCLKDVLACYNEYTPIDPWIPCTTGDDEDRTIRRICVCPSIEECFRGIGLMGRFKRCLAVNEDAKSYETLGIEAYPIVVATFYNVGVWKPTEEQVPDCMLTNEHWITNSTIPDRVELLWLHMRSIHWEYDYIGESYKCTLVNFIPDDKLEYYNHPWINGIGHTLESSENEGYWINGKWYDECSNFTEDGISIINSQIRAVHEWRNNNERYY